MTKLLLIRHATTDSVGKRLSGRTPGVNLNEEGQAQARQLGQRLAGLPIAAIYTSPLERTRQTADALARHHQLTSLVNEAFLELNFGDWTNLSFEELHGNPQFQQFNTFRSVTRIPGGEMMLEAQARFVAGLQELCQKHPHETVAVVSHSDLIKAAVAYYAGIPLDMFQRLEISPASVSVVEVYEETARIMVVNDTGSLMA
ncbi:histidine phosphatase family protein [Rufibacter sediminis]|uniref:Histidine phosphatase family protein n=1 Tax=Rufibacter sediminis TaxID=2762756 RepID=A0ABR6VS17_9BACT|nr:histidine phosphatase family protein [Rufibacter sediminis]MBC3539990.1 histidine phosphatase family protein [Rufibacter sediminis]